MKVAFSFNISKSLVIIIVIALILQFYTRDYEYNRGSDGWTWESWGISGFPLPMLKWEIYNHNISSYSSYKILKEGLIANTLFFAFIIIALEKTVFNSAFIKTQEGGG